ncbi:MAG: hypothetical protein AAF716_19135 [Cyanobacteria bacterium P01_D01_bin.1]
MNTQEFENQYKESVSKILNDLQSMAIISSQLESMVVDVGNSVQHLNSIVEEFIRSQDESV